MRSITPRLHADDDIDYFAEQMVSMVDKLTQERFFRSTAGDSWAPRLNVYELPDRYMICIELAGMRCEDIDIRADDGTLYISGSRSRPALPEAVERISVHLMEIDSGPFRRKLPMPRDVEVNGIAASYKSGYVWIKLPRRRTDPGQGGRS